MKIESFVDVDVVALEVEDQVSVLLQLAAPVAPSDAARPPAALVVVLDRSGSMDGERLWAAHVALCGLVDRLDPVDVFGLVAFDDVATVVVPAGPLVDKAAVKAAILGVDARGTTDLSAGYLRGLQEVARAGCDSARVLIVSDGHANAGVTDPDRLAEVSAKAARDGVTTTTLGLGLGYDETLLGAVARSGNGSELFAEEPDGAIGQIADELEGLLAQTVTAASLLVTPTSDVIGVRVVNDLPSSSVGSGILVELGGFVPGEERKVVLTFDVPGMTALGPVDVASIELRYVLLPNLVEEAVTLPVRVNVVSGEDAADRQVNPVVRTELAFQRTQLAKREASRHLHDGDVLAAGAALRSALGDVGTAIAGAPPMLAAELAGEVDMLTELIAEAEAGSASRASKTMNADAARKSRHH